MEDVYEEFPVLSELSGRWTFGMPDSIVFRLAGYAAGVSGGQSQIRLGMLARCR